LVNKRVIEIGRYITQQPNPVGIVAICATVVFEPQSVHDPGLFSTRAMTIRELIGLKFERNGNIQAAPSIFTECAQRRFEPTELYVYCPIFQSNRTLPRKLPMNRR
jgi:hypothetical protein